MEKPTSRLFFDEDDHKLLGIVNDVLRRRLRPQSASLMMAPYMHPHGIKEMAAPVGLRIAHAIIGLLGSLESGQARDRIFALRSLMDEVFSSSTTMYRKNTARVLIQIMKELVRNEGDELKQLQLAHDFRMVSTGKPSLVRSELRKYFLLEMPEEWNQYAFDDHVHDANTKGRKSPTHLLLDAWIKGIRKLTVVYYNHVDLEVVEELLAAGAVLEIHVRIGIEFSALFRGRFVRFIWELEGFLDDHSLLQFMREQNVRELLEEGKAVSLYQQRYVFDALDAFNSTHRLTMNEEIGLQSDPIDREEFIHYVGAGQPSILHLAKYIQLNYCALLDDEAQTIRRLFPNDPRRRKTLLSPGEKKMPLLGVERIMNRYLQAERNPTLQDPATPRDDMPPLLHLSPPELLSRLASLHANSRFTLNLHRLSLQDTLELIYICEGRITHLESFNLKDANYGLPPADEKERDEACLPGAAEIADQERNYQALGDLQKALNNNNVIVLKRVIRAIIWDFDQRLLLLRQHSEQCPPEAFSDKDKAELEAMNERKNTLLDILLDIESLHKMYSFNHPLGSRIGSGSTGQSQLRYGMGLAVISTLPPRARHTIKEKQQRAAGRKLIPVTARMIHHQHRRTDASSPSRWLGSLLNDSSPVYWKQQANHWSDWTLDQFTIHPGRDGNIVVLGGRRRQAAMGAGIFRAQSEKKIKYPFCYLNSNLSNALKILLGFIPAFLTFALTKDWWLLAYGGAFIWFGITGIRNIIQAVLGGGGLKRSPLLPWSALVNWSRIADSLFFTGLSVPLLDFFVKTLFLQNQLGVTVASDPLILYAVMSFANSVYISTHNILRGLPRAAVVGNLFRSILAIPLAVLFNGIIGEALELSGVTGVDEELQKWAAVISKLASDCVAAIIEGLADRQNNIRIRMMDYREKLSQLFATFSRLDVLFPEDDVLELLQKPKNLIAAIPRNGQELDKIFIVNALDFMYMWMYQPRAPKALQQTVNAMSTEEWLIFYRSQLVLRRTREISQLFVDGLVGKNFAKALSFYLDRADSYLRDMERVGEARALLWKRGGTRHQA